jgi:hypothetical protein
MFCVHRLNPYFSGKIPGLSVFFRTFRFYSTTACMRFCFSFGLLALLLLFACSPNQAPRSPLFQEIFLSDTATFRGSSLGLDIQLVSQHEPLEARHEDKLGLTYEIPLGETRKILVDYFSDNLKTERETNRLASIIANILLADEVETAKLYNEIQQVFSKKYRLASGLYGNYQWQSGNRYTSSIEVRLQLNDDKKGLTLSFIDTEVKYDSESAD